MLMAIVKCTKLNEIQTRTYLRIFLPCIKDICKNSAVTVSWYVVWWPMALLRNLEMIATKYHKTVVAMVLLLVIHINEISIFNF